MRPKSRSAENVAECVPCNMLGGDCRLFRKVQPGPTIEDLKILMLVEMLDIAPDRVKFTHQFVVSGADEQLVLLLNCFAPFPGSERMSPSMQRQN